MPTAVGDVIIEYDDPVPDASPLPDQNGPCTDPPFRNSLLTNLFAAIANTVKDPLRGRLETAERSFLEAVGDRPIRRDRPIWPDGSLPYNLFQRSRRSLILAFDRPATSALSALPSRAAARRFMIVPLDISRRSAHHPSSYVVLLEARDLPPQ
jgi:hypothetical protein